MSPAILAAPYDALNEADEQWPISTSGMCALTVVPSAEIMCMPVAYRDRYWQ